MAEQRDRERPMAGENAIVATLIDLARVIRRVEREAAEQRRTIHLVENPKGRNVA